MNNDFIIPDTRDIHQRLYDEKLRETDVGVLQAIQALAEKLIANEFKNVHLELLDDKNNMDVFRRVEMKRFMVEIKNILEGLK